MSQINPFQAPQTNLAPAPVYDQQELWSNGRLLVARIGARLPDRCVRCNQDANGYRLSQSYSWHSAFWFSTLLLGPLIYVIVAILVRKTGSIELGICPRHRAMRRNALWTSLLTVTAGVALIILGGNQTLGPWALAVGVAMFIGGLVWGILRFPPLKVKRIDKRHIWLSKANSDFLAELPDWAPE